MLITEQNRSSFSTNSDNRGVEVGHDVDRVLVTQERVNSPTDRTSESLGFVAANEQTAFVRIYTGRHRSLLTRRIVDSQSITVIFHYHWATLAGDSSAEAFEFNPLRWQLIADHNERPCTTIRRFLFLLELVRRDIVTISPDRNYSEVINLSFVLPGLHLNIKNIPRH